MDRFSRNEGIKLGDPAGDRVYQRRADSLPDKMTGKSEPTEISAARLADRIVELSCCLARTEFIGYVRISVRYYFNSR